MQRPILGQQTPQTRQGRQALIKVCLAVSQWILASLKANDNIMP